MKKVCLSAAMLLAAASSVCAETVYIPTPNTGGIGSPKTLIEVSKLASGPQTLTVGFIPTGQNGTSIAGTSRNVNNYFRPNVFDASRFIPATPGVGMLKITDEPGIRPVVAALSLETRSEDTHWPLPIISSSNWFTVGETAYIENLERSRTGATNIEIMNFANVASNCRVLLRRPRGTETGPAKTFVVPPLSHKVFPQILDGAINVPTAVGLHAEVACDRPFYAYGTFVDSSPLNFRMLYPLDLPPRAVVETVTFNRPGNFFSPVPGASELSFDLPLVPGRAYRKAEIEFDMFIDEFTPIFTSIFGFFHPGGPRFGKTLYFGANIRGMRGRTLLDLGTPAIESAPKRNTAWQEQTTYRVRIVYDTEAAMVTFQARKRGGAIVLYSQSGAFNLDLADRGAPVKINFGLQSVADNAYYPPIGWRFSNLEVRVTR